MGLGSSDGYNINNIPLTATSYLDPTTISPGLGATTSERAGSNEKWGPLPIEQQHHVDQCDKIR